MLTERRKWLTWIIFPPEAHLRARCRTVYLQAKSKVDLYSHVRRPFVSYEIDLNQSERDLFGGYTKKLRQKIRNAEQTGVEIERDQNPYEVIRLFRPVVAEKGLNAIGPATFASKTDLLITRAVLAEVGTLAAHAYQLDYATGRIRGLYNASAFRERPEDPDWQRLCSQANCLLYHRDFLKFRDLGFVDYDFAGYGTPATGSRFKDQFRGRVVTQYNYYPRPYYWWRQLRNWLRNKPTL